MTVGNTAIFFHIIIGEVFVISIEELSKFNFKDTIDIRSNKDYNEGSIPNSINIPRKNLLLHPEKFLKKDKKYYLYCDSGEKSLKVSKELKELGYNTINIEGGYNAYKKYLKR